MDHQFFLSYTRKADVFFLANRWMVQGNHTKNAQNETGCNERALVFTHKSGALQHVECKVTGQSLRWFTENFCQMLLYLIRSGARKYIIFERKFFACLSNVKCNIWFGNFRLILNMITTHPLDDRWRRTSYIE